MSKKQPYQIVFALANAPKIERKSGIKSKTGCLTCKARHVKCSEERPVCRRCVLSGKKCAGYAPQARSLPISRDGTPLRRSNSPPSANTDLSLTVDTALGLPRKLIDRRYFEHFRNRSAESLSRLGDQEFWSNIVLRFSASRPTIQYAVLALSAQHEAHSKGGIIALSNSSAASLYGLQKYSKGIKCLNEILASATSEFDLLEVVVACVLFASFEILQGNGNGAMRHARGGLQILSSQISNQKKENDAKLQAVLKSKPAKFLIRLDVDTATYGGSENVHPLAIPPTCSLASLQQQKQQQVHREEIKRQLPIAPLETRVFVFESIVRARDDLYTLLACNYYFERNIADPLQDFRYDCLSASDRQETLDSIPNHSDTFKIPEHVLTFQESLLANMRNWNSDLQALVEPLLDAPPNDRAVWTGITASKAALMREYAAISVAYMSSYMSIYTCLADVEEAQGLYDRLLPQFQSLVQNAEIMVLPELSMDKRPVDWEWSVLDMQGVIQPLAFCALKCRDRKLRNHAILLLSMSGRKGGWDGQNMAQLVRCVVDYEERQAREEKEIEKSQNTVTLNDGPHEYKDLEIPLCARVFRTEIDMDKINRRVRIWMKCARDERGYTAELNLINEEQVAG